MTKKFQNHSYLCWLALLLYLVPGKSLTSQAVPGKAKVRSGPQIFASNCASCHGLDGRGSERAPNIAANAKVERMSNDQVFRIISEGITGTGMPAFHSLTAAERRAVVRQLRILQGRNHAKALPGDSPGGRSIFFGKRECSSCHMVAGKGGFLASDLTTFASGKSPAQVKEAILNPGSNPDPHRRKAIISTPNGTKLEGIVRNQDNFSVQLQTQDGAFHYLNKSDIENLHFSSDPHMPGDYTNKLSATEINNLISYLLSVAPTAKDRSSGKGEE